MPAWRVLLLAALLAPASGCASPFPGSGGPGGKWKDYVTGGGVLLLEIDHSPGAAPSQRVLSALRAELGELTAKTVDVVTAGDLPARGAGHVYAVSDLKDLHEAHQDEADRRGVVAMHALFVDGRLVGSSGGPAGLAFSEDAFAVGFGTIESFTCEDGSLACLGQVEESNAVRAVAVHEAGHLAGLVNLGLDMVAPHEMTRDPDTDTDANEGRGHSRNDASVMWWEVDLSIGLQGLIDRGASVPHEFDANDLQDARAARSG